MGAKRMSIRIGAALLCAMASHATAQLLESHTYQGRLEVSGAPAVGVHQIRFDVYDAASGGTMLATLTRQKNFSAADAGLFSFNDLDFGDVFASGADRWIQLSARAGTIGAFTSLGPRQPVTSAPTASVAGRLALPYADSAPLIDSSDILRLSGTVPQFASHTAHFVSGGTVTPWSAAGLVAESNSVFGLIGSGGTATGGVAGAAYIDGSDGVRADRFASNPSGAALFVFDLADGNDVQLGTSTHAGEFYGDTYFTGDLDILGEGIDSTEIRDEPGLASQSLSSVIVPSAAYGAVLSRTISVPGPGYVFAIASSEAEITHTAGGFTRVEYGLSAVMNSPGFGVRFDLLPSSLPNGSYNNCITDTTVFSVGGAGSFTYYFVTKVTGGVATLFDPQMTLLYVPTAYGTLTATSTGPALDRASLPAPRGPLTPAEIAQERANEQQRAMDELVRRQAEIDRLVAEQRSALEALRAPIAIE